MLDRQVSQGVHTIEVWAYNSPYKPRTGHMRIFLLCVVLLHRASYIANLHIYDLGEAIRMVINATPAV